MSRKPRHPIIILFTGHVGSSWLTSLLASHESISQLGFEPVDDFVQSNIDAAPILERILQGESISQFQQPVRDILLRNYESLDERDPLTGAGAPEGPDTRLLVFKTRLYLEEQRALFADLFPRLDPTVVLLCRRNKIKNAISQFKRTQLSISHLGEFHEIEDKRKPVKVDPVYILNQATNFLKRELHLKIYFEQLGKLTSASSFEVFYEDLLIPQSRSGFLELVFNELGLRSNQCESIYLKMTPNRIQDAVVNFDALYDVLRGTVFEPSLSSDDYDVVDEIYTGRFEFPGVNTESMRKYIQTSLGVFEDG